MLKVYQHPRSTYSRRVMICLLEKKIPHEATVVDMAVKAHKAPEYLSLNPYGRVPVIDDGGFVLYESTAILNYLEAIHPAPALVPPDPKARALVDMHMKLCDVQMGGYVGTIIFPKRFLKKERWNVEAMDAAKAAIEIHLEILRKSLAGKTYLVAEKFSLADLTYLPFLHFLPLMEIDPPPAVRDWAERLLGRDSAKQTVPDA
jgi:glutathione S-transferase